MFKVLDKNLYWSMNDDNRCIDNWNKYFEFLEKIKDIDKSFDKIINHLFNTNDEVINYLFTEKNLVQKKQSEIQYFMIKI